ncbi:urokinase plasminogen activator surface receptor-like isoform X1 [Silurus meridionalis]|uniref:urokinase plasminogen activator surface receptor-like isoform X1 n=1 Tax=Silurus meridionalis TaxID=175797 RepID=UPI001EEB41A7|nr:urokinase plasminogen activator surface receptor-like isoform X1 [Silurus meridionalis]
MKFSIVLLFSCILVPEVLMLTCQQCTSTINKPCPSTPVNCSNVCSSTTGSIYISTLNATIVGTVQNCTTPDMCVNGSLNLGLTNTVVNTQCCSTDFCNNQTLPVPSQQLPNGMSCYTCINNTCSGTIQCVGDQNYCVSVNTDLGENNVLVQAGCTTKSVCDAFTLFGTQLVANSTVKCCQGNLCNDAKSLTLSFLPMIIPLLCSIIFY